MVIAWRRARLGGSTIGCVLSLALFAIASYYAIHIGQVYLRYYEVLDAMHSQARLAHGLTDAAVRERLAARADSVLPGRTPRFTVERNRARTRITIRTEYRDEVRLPLFHHTFVFRPKVEAPL